MIVIGALCVWVTHQIDSSWSSPSKESPAIKLDTADIEGRKRVEALKAAQTNDELVVQRLQRANEHRANLIRNSGLDKYLRKKPTGEAIIWYEPDDVESFQVAETFDSILSDAQWIVKNRPIPVPSDAGEGSGKNLPFRLRVTGSSHWLVLMANSVDPGDFSKEVATPSTPVMALFSGLARAKIGTELREDRSLPDGCVRIVVWKRW